MIYSIYATHNDPKENPKNTASGDMPNISGSPKQYMKIPMDKKNADKTKLEKNLRSILSLSNSISYL
jgi:hypothetical protein